MNENIRKLLIIALTAIVLCGGLAVTGCGGGSSGSTMSPDELEVASVLDAFASAVNEENIDQAMSYIFSGLVYYGGSNTASPLGNPDLRGRLETFFSRASGINCQFSSPGITLTSETTATVRALLIVDYSVSGISQTMPPENVELSFEKDRRWGIVGFARYDKTTGTAITAFPPQ